MQGKVAIVTGAGSGIGAACAMEFAARGAAVVVTDVRGDTAEKTAKEIGNAGGRAMAMEVNVRDEAAVRGMIDGAVERFGGLHILHNNAAATHESVQDDDLTTMDVAIWDLSMEVNLRGAMLGCKYAIPVMIEGGGGVIINTSSGSAVIGEPTRFAYGASKAGMNALTRSIAARYGKDNIRAVGIAPGITLTDEGKAGLSEYGPGWLAMMERHHATPKLGKPEDIAKFAAFLASDDASFITGSTLPIDGGSSSAAPYAADMRQFGTGLF